MREKNNACRFLIGKPEGKKPLKIYTVTQEDRSIFREVILTVILGKEMYTYMCHIPNGFRDRAVSLYSSKTVDKKISMCLIGKIFL
jgi:hypothetical protein